ncbi:Glutathione S-transferase T3 [Cardamine amara subsp. amara]|uniref:Glutathione S-transferase T3 n=1 Tax=Cardamine amara subsp. amara TaxID=228776 RepID=A0ABD1C2N5_CARAN
MDYTNLYSQSANFMDLLNSQGDNQNPQPIQCSDDPNLEQELHEECKERKRWTHIDDIVLISSWLNTSKDAVVANEQKSGAFWACVAALFAASPKVAASDRREASHCKQRWRKINDLVCKFSGAYEAAKNQKKSGYNDNDYLKLAHQIFLSDHKVKFNLEHAWNELRHDQKWCANSYSKGGGEGSGKRRKCEEGSAQSSSSQTVTNGEDEVMVRPPGVKATKAKVKRTASKTVDQQEKLLHFQTMWEIKQKDLALKDKLSDKKLLDSLLAKSEPLSKIELALKNKLITDML